jgi:hypothetical protein
MEICLWASQRPLSMPSSLEKVSPSLLSEVKQ